MLSLLVLYINAYLLLKITCFKQYNFDSSNCEACGNYFEIVTKQGTKDSLNCNSKNVFLLRKAGQLY